MDMSKRTWLLIGGAVLLTGIGWWLFAKPSAVPINEGGDAQVALDGESKDEMKAIENAIEGEATHLGTPLPGKTEGLATVLTQPSGSQVIVQNVALEVPGWLVIHEVTDGLIGNALGAARRDAGSHDNVSIDLLRETMPGQTYALILYRDNGNKTFEIHGDMPMVDTSGVPLVTTFETN